MALKIGIIDTGLSLRSYDGIHRITIYEDEQGAIKSEEETGGDAFGHGTICYQLVKETCPTANFLIVKIFASQYWVKEEVLIAAVVRCLEEKVDLINISLGIKTPKISPSLGKVLNRAFKLNVPIIAAAHRDNVRSFPASYPTVYGVGLMADQDVGEIVYCANADINILLNTVYFGEPVTQATSFACAKVSGLIAKIIQDLDVTDRVRSTIISRLLKVVNNRV